MRRQYRHICPVCGQEFKALRQAVTCSNACRQKKSRAGVYEVVISTPEFENRTQYSIHTDALKAYYLANTEHPGKVTLNML